MTHLGLKVENVTSQPWVLYGVFTGHGSQLSIYFKHEQNFLNPETGETYCKAGGIHVTGYSESRQEHVDFWGLGFEPEIDGHVAVAILGKREDGTPIIAEEMISDITSKIIVGYDKE